MSQADNLAALGSNVNTSGVLQPAGGGTGTTTATGTGSVVLSSGATLTNATINGAVASGFTMKNRIINGDMVIDQRNAGASVTPANGAVTYTVDRWAFFVNQTSKLTAQQNAGSVTPPVGFTNYLGVTSSSAYSSGASDIFAMFQFVEGYNIADLAWGTANAKTITLSFWVRSSLTGTHSGAISNSGNSRSYPFSFTISSANTWTQISVTIPGDTSGTWLTTNGAGLSVKFNCGCGSSLLGTANAWAAADYAGVTGSVSLVGTNGATFYITGVQLEQGSAATSFEWRPYDMEFASCQRYYIGDGTTYYSQGAVDSAYNTEGMFINLPVQMRISPTIVGYNYMKSGHIDGSNAVRPANNDAAPSSTSLLLRWNSSSTAYRPYGYAGWIQPYLSAEL